MRCIGLVLPACALLALPLARAQAPADPARNLFEQAFSKRPARDVRRLSLPTTLDGREIGLLDAEVGAAGVRMVRKPLADALRRVLRDEVYQQLAAGNPADLLGAQELRALGLTAVYSPQRIAVDMQVPLELRAVRDIRLGAREIEDPQEQTVRIAAQPYSLLANWRWAASRQTADGAVLNRSRLFADGALRAGEWVLEGGGSAATDGTGAGFERYESRLVRDWPAQGIRLVAGDLTTATRAGLATLTLGGVRLGRQYGLNPTLNSQAQPAQTLGVPGGATVDVEVNGFVVRTLRLDPGVYNLREIPVFNGANDVLLRIVEPGGRVTEQRASYFFDATLLAPGLGEWELAVGAPVQSGVGGRAYASGQRVGSGWWRYGLTGALTGGVGLQWRHGGEGSARVLQTEAVWATRMGTLAGWVARSQNTWGGGQAAALQWRVGTRTGADSSFGASLAAQVQRSQDGFAPVDADRPAGRALDAGLRIGAVWGKGWGATLALARRTSAQPEGARSTQTLALRRRLSRQWSVDVGANRSRAGASSAVLAGYVTLRFSGEEDPAGTAVRATAAYQSEDRRMQLDSEATGVASVAGGDAGWRVAAGHARARSGDETRLTGQLFTGRGELTAGTTYVRQALGTSRLDELTVASALVLSRAGLHVAAPVNDSVAVLVPRKGLEGLKLLVDPQRSRVAAASDALGVPVLGDLQAYSPREIQLDVENLPPGRSLGVDRPVLTPSYRSVLLVPVGSDANTQVRGQLVNAQKQPMALQALRLTALKVKAAAEPIELFTTRRGGFMSPPLPPGTYLLTRPGVAVPLARVEIGEDQAGVLELGLVVLQEDAP